MMRFGCVSVLFSLSLATFGQNQIKPLPATVQHVVIDQDLARITREVGALNALETLQRISDAAGAQFDSDADREVAMDKVKGLYIFQMGTALMIAQHAGQTEGNTESHLSETNSKEAKAYGDLLRKGGANQEKVDQMIFVLNHSMTQGPVEGKVNYGSSQVDRVGTVFGSISQAVTNIFDRHPPPGSPAPQFENAPILADILNRIDMIDGSGQAADLFKRKMALDSVPLSDPSKVDEWWIIEEGKFKGAAEAAYDSSMRSLLTRAMQADHNNYKQVDMNNLSNNDTKTKVFLNLMLAVRGTTRQGYDLQAASRVLANDKNRGTGSATLQGHVGHRFGPYGLRETGQGSAVSIERESSYGLGG